MKILNGLSIPNPQRLLDKHLLASIGAYFVVSMPFVSRYLYNWDAGQFALGTKAFSLLEHQPHPPGYYLFVKTAQLFDGIFHDINAAFVCINVLAGLLMLVIFYRFIKDLTAHGPRSFWLTLLCITSPVLWFYRCVALTYTFEALTATVLAHTTWLTLTRGKNFFAVSMFCTMLLAGFRPSVLIIAFPFLLAQCFTAPHTIRTLGSTFLASGAGLLLWLPGLAYESGGVRALTELVISQLSSARGTAVYDIDQKLFLLKSIFAIAVVPALVMFSNPRAVWRFAKEKKLTIVVIAIGLQILVYRVLHFGEVGYLLAIIPLLYSVCAPVVMHWKYPAVFTGALILIQGVLFFFGMPFVDDHKIERLAYRDIRAHDERIAKHLEFVRQYDPHTTLVIALRGQYLGPNGSGASYPYDDIRTLGYYLPQYTLYDMLGVRGTYFTALNYRYQPMRGTEILVSQDINHVVFLADYIHPTMRPTALDLQSVSWQPSRSNVYWASFSANEFEYNGMIFRKSKKSD